MYFGQKKRRPADRGELYETTRGEKGKMRAGFERFFWSKEICLSCRISQLVVMYKEAGNIDDGGIEHHDEVEASERIIKSSGIVSTNLNGFLSSLFRINAK